jgi:phosphonate degradation associated HDIG domain protein
MYSTLDAERIEALFQGYGTILYGGEGVSQTEHALQCATRAERAGEGPAMIVASLLHDIGHLLRVQSGDHDRRHQDVAALALRGWLDDDVIAPIRLHVAAKRYLCAVEDGYWESLSQASKDSLALQGGAYDAALVAGFRQYSYHAAAVRLRRYDDASKIKGGQTKPLGHFLGMVAKLDVRNTVTG